MRTLLPLFLLLIPLGMLFRRDALEPHFLPLPTDNRMDPRVEKKSSKARKAWFKERHRAPPPLDWLQIERENGRAQILKRNHRAPPLEGQEKWVERGSVNQAGRMHTVKSLPDGTLYAGSALGGLWKRQGEQWQPLGDNLYGGVHWLGLLPREGEVPVILAGTDWGSLYRTLDEGQSWAAPSGLPTISELRRLIVAPDRRIYLVTGSWGSYRLLRSDDEGVSFTTLRQLGNQPADLWTHRDVPGSLYLYSEDKLERSDDGGESWTGIGSIGEPAEAVWLVGSEAGGGDPRLYLIAQKGGYFLWVSDDGGRNWTRGAQVPDYWGNLEASRDHRDLFVCGGFEVYRSHDGGQSLERAYDWALYYDQPATQLHADLMGLDVERTEEGEEIWYISTDGGAYESRDGLDNVLNLSMYGLRVSQYYSTLTSSNGKIAAGAQDQGYQLSEQAEGELYHFSQEISGDYGHLSSPDNSHQWVFSTYPGFILVQYGEDRPRYFDLDFPGRERYAWIPPVVAAPEEPGEFYFPASKLYRYVLERGNWEPTLWSEQDFTTRSDEYISALSFSKVDPQRAYAVTSYGALWWSQDMGKTWKKSEDTGPRGEYFYGAALLPSASDALVAWVGGSGYGSPPVYRTEDGGESWSSWSEGLPDTLVYSLAEAPDGSGRIAAGTETAAYLRGPEDPAWVDITGNQAPITIYWSVETLVSENTFRFGTYGRGIWDYQMDPEHLGCVPVQDYDGDGILCNEDCDDHDARRFPGAEDSCDEIDQNCDPAGEADADGDGVLGCQDCNDIVADAFPGGRELCGDGIDQDCDGRDLRCEAQGCGCDSGGSPELLGLLALAGFLRRRPQP